MKDILEHTQSLVDAKDMAKNALELKAQMADFAQNKAAFMEHTASLTGHADAASAAGDGLSAKAYNKYHSLGHGLVGVGAGAAMVGASGVGAGQGIAAGRAAEAVGRNPEAESKIRTMFILGMGIAESAAIYSLIVSILLLFVF